MGACEFVTVGKGKTAKDAFHKAVEYDQHENGHSAYSGSIGQKYEYKMVSGFSPKTVKEGYALAEKLLNEDDETYGDKWGPCHCIPVEGTDAFIFFGWAAS